MIICDVNKKGKESRGERKMSLSKCVVDKNELIKLWSEVKFMEKYSCFTCEKEVVRVVDYYEDPFKYYGVRFVCHGGNDAVMYTVSRMDLYDPNRQDPGFGKLSGVGTIEVRNCGPGCVKST
jgi:hypothetical protein